MLPSISPQSLKKSPSDKPRFTYSYAYPDWLRDSHRRIVEAVDRFRLIDSNQLIRLTGWPKVRVHRFTQALEEKNYIKSFGRGAWAKTDGTRRAHIWGLLPRGAWLRSLETGTQLSEYKTYKYGSPAPTSAEHSIDLADIRISFEQHAAEVGIEVAQWKDELEWRVGEALHVPSPSRVKGMDVRPDGSVLLKDPRGFKTYLFIEADRTNRNNWAEKIRAYKDFYALGEFHRQFRITDMTVSFRVIVSTKTQHRADYLKAQAEKVDREDLAGLFLFAPITAVATTPNVFTALMWGRGGQVARQALYQPAGSTPVLVYESAALATDLAQQDQLPTPQFQLSLETV